MNIPTNKKDFNVLKIEKLEIWIPKKSQIDKALSLFLPEKLDPSKLISIIERSVCWVLNVEKVQLKELKIGGLKIYSFNENISLELYEDSFAQKEYRNIIRNIEKLKNKDFLFFDCGANIGVYILKLKDKFPNLQSICFEPDPLSFLVLIANSLINNLSNLTLINAALSDKTDSKKMYGEVNNIHADSRGNSLVEEWGDRENCGSIIVRAVALSDFINNRSYIKIDVEGEELNIIKNLEKFGKLRKVEGLHIEVHTTIKDKIDKYLEIQKILSNNGFEITFNEEKEFEQYLSNNLKKWKKQMSARIFTIEAIKKKFI